MGCYTCCVSLLSLLTDCGGLRYHPNAFPMRKIEVFTFSEKELKSQILFAFPQHTHG